nr:mitochondrial uncoupling protein 2-like [Nomia melanderi]
MSTMKKQAQANHLPFWTNFLTAGTAACIADLMTFPLDTAKVRMQIAGESGALLATKSSMLSMRQAQPGLWTTVWNIVRVEGARYVVHDPNRNLRATGPVVASNNRSGAQNIYVRIAAGITTGALAVLLAQPTDVVKVRLQAAGSGRSSTRYSSTLQAYKNIVAEEGTRGLWKGTMPNVSRNAIVNVAEIVCYDSIKDKILDSGYMRDGIPCHVTAAVAAGLCTTLVASPVDVVKTRYMNSSPGEYKGVRECAVRMFRKEGPSAFYKGFVPSFTRLVSWNIILWITYEQFKIHLAKKIDDQ